jgi:HD domain
MHDKFKKKYRVATASERLRRQIALEAARRLIDATGPRDDASSLDWLEGTTGNDFYVAKRKAAAVLGHRVRPGDLPADSEVREQVVILWRSRSAAPDDDDADEPMPEPEDGEAPLALAQHLDRFAVYRVRLTPLEAIKQNPKFHPEGDALYHSLQVFHLAREARPYDEEFLLAALLHDVGKAIDDKAHCTAGAEALRGAVTERTLWLIEHHMDLLIARERTLNARVRRELEESEYLDDLKLLRELDDAGRIPGMVVETLDAVLAYIKGLEHEAYLED